ncbi:amidohydrolase [bacterium]|nr:amidohydrolase [bacterium]
MVIFLFFIFFGFNSLGQMQSLSSEAAIASKELLPLYHQFHQNPELSLKEEQTGSLLAQSLEKEGMKVTFPFAGTGVVGVFQNGPGKTVLLRADLDALPITENTALAFASKKTGVMHACGHDIHMTNLVGTVRLLIKNKQKWRGTLIAIGQPAEEVGRGAKNMIAAGLLKKFPKPDYAIAFHVDSHLPTGTLGYVSGPVMAAADSVDVVIRGKGGHGALPQENIDPIVIASRFVMDLQTLISREREPTEPSVISVGKFQCGTKHNITPESCQLELTVRSFDKTERKRLLEGIRRKAEASALSSGAPKPTVEFSKEGTGATFNDPQLTQKVIDILEKQFGKKVLIPSKPATVSEDFSVYGDSGIPAVLLFLGSVSEKRLSKLSSKGSSLPSTPGVLSGR